MNNSLNRIIFLSTATLAIGFGGLSAKAEPVNSSTGGAIASSQLPLTNPSLNSSDLSLPGSTSATALGTRAIEVNSQILAQTSTGGSGTTSEPGQPLETNPVPPGSGTALPNPLDPTPTNPGRLDQDTSTQDPRTPGLSTPDSTLPETTVPNPTTSQPSPDYSTPDSSTPGTTSPDYSTPGSSTPDTTSPGSSSQAEPDRTPPGTFTPDTSGVSPGRATRSGPSYIGVGGNIGLGDGDTALGEGSFSIFSKIGLTSNISVRPNVLVSDNPTILLPITLDFIPLVTRVTENLSNRVGLNVSPYVGAGVAISTGDDSSVDFLATGGVDVPLSRRVTATAAVNATLFDNPAVGLVLGVGYNF